MRPTVIVVGSINVDLFVYVHRLPRPGETVIGGKFSRAHGGKGANQAVAAARLGADVVFVGMVGDDDLGRSALEELGKEGVSLDEVRIGGNHTGVAQILVEDSGENMIAVATGANSDVSAEMVVDSLARINVDGAVVGAVLEIPDSAVAAAATVAAERGWRFILNPAPARTVSKDLLKRCYLLTPNEHEVAELGVDSPEDLLRGGAEAVAVTRGAAGAELLRPGLPPHRRSAFEVTAVDTTGAGDAFSGAVAWALADGAGLEAALELASGAAALSTQQRGARSGMPTRPQLEALLG